MSRMSPLPSFSDHFFQFRNGIMIKIKVIVLILKDTTVSLESFNSIDSSRVQTESRTLIVTTIHTKQMF